MENTQAVKEKSYAQFIKEITNEDIKDFKGFLSITEHFELVESQETTFNNLRMSVLFKQLPVVSDANLLVKVVAVVQGESIAFMMPKNAADIYVALKESPDSIASKNVSLELYGEVFGFDVKDASFIDAVKNSYLSAGNAAPAFEFKNPELEEKENPEEQDEALEQPKRPIIAEEIPSDAGIEDAPEFEPPFEKIGATPGNSGLERNMESFKNFSKTGKHLEHLLKDLSESTPSVLKNYTKYKFIGENDAILVLEVDNRAIIERFKNKADIAKKALSNYGESIRNYKNTQLIDSFIEDGKRYHVIAEAAGNNFWVVDGEGLLSPSEMDIKSDVIIPLKESVIRLRASSVRKDSRKYIPAMVKGEIVFLGGK